MIHPVAVAILLLLGCYSSAVAADGGGANQREIVNSIDMRLVLIPAGEFSMGSGDSIESLLQSFPAYDVAKKTDYLFQDEHPQHRVRITEPFYLGRCEVTVGQFKQFVTEASYRTEAERDGTGGWGYNPETGLCEGRKLKYSWRDPGFKQGDSHPVVNVTWQDAVAFCEWLSRKEGKTYRLPTEAQWEYACRAAAQTRYNYGDDPADLRKVANLIDAADPKAFAHVQEVVMPKDGEFTIPVGKLRANAWGLHDMHGNVWEWCADWYGEDYYRQSPIENPLGPSTGKVRVRRGGAWNSFPLYLRASFRNWNQPGSRCVNLGFRVVREAVPAGRK